MGHTLRTSPRPLNAAAVAAVTAVVAVPLLLTSGCSDSGGSGSSGSSGGSGGAANSPAPTRPSHIGPAPVSVPSVRDWRSQRGPGWELSKSTRVVADAGSPVAAEGRLLARQLKVPFSEGPARTGDVALNLDPSVRGKTGAEGYVLTSQQGQVKITGAAASGVFHGTRTVLQSARARGGIGDGVAHDRPDRSQRGLLLDVARKHYTAGWIEDRIREMGELKLNQLQLHLTDDQGFRIESRSHPEVVSKQHLTRAQVRHILKVADSRHVTVIPEIDSPGHLGAVLRAHPEFQLKDASGAPTRGAVDVGSPAAAGLVDDLLREYARLFPGRYVHLGGDEYPALLKRDPEASYPGLASVARKRYGEGATVRDLATAWLNGRVKTVRDAGKTPEVWDDGMFAGGRVRPHRERQVGYWTGREPGKRDPADYLREGRKTVNLNDEFMYYVLGQPNNFRYPTGRRIYRDWSPAVLRGTRPVPDSLSGPSHIPGGRFAVWGDIADAQTPQQVADGIRMPLAATAQKLWVPGKPEESWADFKKTVKKVS